MIKIIAVGKLNQKYLNQGIDYYEKQIPSKVEFIEVSDESTEQGIVLEGERILSKIKDSDFVVALAIKGKIIDSYDFSKLLDQNLTYHQGDLVFIIGGSYGLSEDVLKRANQKISFSQMTFPHQLMRLILIEQIYRGFMILKNHPYHK
ncbi:23S rRNA (pseudouridine(1915)-N(3))-methyltransferase RlmH [Peloplasma aerotolerans]|uniref:Ribosomal RNA large subunit methyltransferase H n=1 Tax=Peloplasma aerotolerans TaxID=3044389 RepID=A0AAW6U9M8_9MOLU|nr:23S rRNA (pseudouridine(1915)-N(3))-methyltransferase RlmH [Mariniplasma sp. M4Ah]MDI6452659.1 23S rRNA (pseudouridine(1915)-N(3))-methyltransferase RlmH [Mariniplasma sp. M4Ah]